MADSLHPLAMLLPLAAGPVRLRELASTDVDEFLAYRSDPEVARYQGWQLIDRAAALAYLSNATPTPWIEGEWAQIGIARSADDGLVGDIGLLREGEAQVQLGFSLARSAQRQGLATKAVNACIDALLRPICVTKLRAVTDERNIASRRLLRRLDFLELKRESVLFRGQPCTEITFERNL